MTFTVSTLAKSLAEHLSHYLPATFYEDPIQQGIDLPAIWLQVRTNEISLRTNGRYLRTLNVTLTYLEQFEQTDLQRKYQEALEILDECMETFQYSDGTDSCLLRTYNRNGTVNEESANYNFELRVWVYPKNNGIPMQTMTYSEEILNG